MSRKAAVKLSQATDFDGFDALNFEDMLLETGEEDAMLSMLSRLTEIDRDQSQVSLGLTRLIVEHASGSNLKRKEILSIFKEAKQTVTSCSPLHELWEKMSS